MSDTPETDSESFDARGLTYCCHVVPEDFAQNLERERNEWRECAEMMAALPRGRCCDNGYCKKCLAALDKFKRLKEAIK
jgi:hypothetical protein